MRCYFFTYVDENPTYRRESDILIASGKKFGRDIHRYEIPAGEMWNRYKVNLIASDLPDADRYICLDSDTVLTCHGDWEADDCQGVSDILYYIPERRDHYTHSFIKNHTVLDGDAGAYEFILELWRQMGYPIWCNSGVVVVDADFRRDMTGIWKRWMDEIDSHCDRGFVNGDEAPLMFARHENNWPFLPPRFNGLCKWQPIYDWHVLIHADGNVTGEKREPYNAAVRKVLDE